MINFAKDIHIGSTLYIVNGKDIFEIEIHDIVKSKSGILEFYFYINWIYYSYSSGKQELIDLNWKTVASDLKYLQLHIVDSSKPNLFRSNLIYAKNLYKSLDAAESFVCTAKTDWIDSLQMGDKLTADRYYLTNSYVTPTIKIGQVITIGEQVTHKDYIKIILEDSSDWIVEKRFFKSLFDGIPKIIKADLDTSMYIGKYYQCITDHGVFQKEEKSPFNIIKVITIQDILVCVNCPNFKNPLETFYLGLESFLKFFKPYHEELQTTPQSISERPGSSPIAVGCDGSIVANSKRLVGNPARIVEHEIQIKCSIGRQTGSVVNQ